MSSEPAQSWLVRELIQLTAAISQMLDSGEPLSFYDATVAVRRARGIGDLDDACVNALVAMHDAEGVTDGARVVLSEFLAGYARRVAAERERAGRPITLGDHGKHVRLAAGARLTLRLEEKAAAGFRWQVERVARGVRVERVGRVPGGDTLVDYRVTVNRPGRTRLRMTESRPASVDYATGDEGDPATFELVLAVEPA